MKQKIALAGVPNCGKTTLWNYSTGKKGKTGNWPGVTLEKLSAPLRFFPEIELIDLPGIYSLSGKSPEEKISNNFLKSNFSDSVVIIIDGTKPEQGIYLALELLSLEIPAVIGINFCDELRKKGVSVDIDKLSTELGSPVFLISAATGENVRNLFFTAKNSTKNAAPKIHSVIERHEKASFIAETCFFKSKEADKNNKTHPLFVLTAFIIAAFAVSAVLKVSVVSFFERASAISSALMNYFHFPFLLRSFFAEGLLSGFSILFSFVPDLLLFFLIFSLLENSGYVARFAFYSDFLLRKVGFSGKSAIPMLIGFGCTVPAIYSAKALDNEHDRNRTLSLLMFTPCSAKYPLSILMCEIVAPGFGKILILLFYATVILFGIIFIFFGKKTSPGFILELPEIRIPPVKSTIKSTYIKLSSFISKAALMIVLSLVLIWVLKNFSLDFRFSVPYEDSILFYLSKTLSVIFSPCGIPFEGAAALICGIFSKETALFTLLSLCGNLSEIFSPVSAVSFLIFYLFYTPCISSLICICNHYSIKKAALLFLQQTALAYFLSFSFYQISLFIFNVFIR